MGECIFIYSGRARLVSFEIKLISKEVSRAEPEYMNIHPPISVLATALKLSLANKHNDTSKNSLLNELSCESLHTKKENKFAKFIYL